MPKKTDEYAFTTTFDTIKKADDGSTKLIHRLESTYYGLDYGDLVFQQQQQIGKTTERLLAAGESMADAMGLGDKARGTIPAPVATEETEIDDV